MEETHITGLAISAAQLHEWGRAAVLEGLELIDWLTKVADEAAAAKRRQSRKPRSSGRPLRPRECAHCGATLPLPAKRGRPRLYCPQPRPCRDLARNARQRAVA
jgi:hypothetical protein